MRRTNNNKKILREITPEVDYYDSWITYAREVGFIDKTYQELKDEAERRGVPLDEVSREHSLEYKEVRIAWESEMNVKREADQQRSLLRNNTLDSICHVYQRADRILTGLDVEVNLTDNTADDTPAYNDGVNITFNSVFINALDEDTIGTLHGLNYHEVAHLLFTPRVGSELGKWVKDNNLLAEFNILEDSRAERLLVAKYPSVREFLISMVGEYLTSEPSLLTENFIVLAGRRYFSLSARKLSGSLFASKYGVDKARQVYSIVNEYSLLSFPQDYDRAKELILEFAQASESVSKASCGCAERPIMRNGRPQSGKEQSQLQDKAGNNDGDFNFDGKGDEQSTDDNNSTGGSQLGEGDDNNPTTKDFRTEGNDLLTLLQAEVERAKSDKKVRDKITETQRAIAKSQGTKSLLGRRVGELNEPTNSDITASVQFGNELERLRIDLDPAWLREVPSGKLNVRRAMLADVNEINKLFDRWDTGNDDHDIEACILIDRSGSMSSDIGSACRASWIIKRGIERINGRVTVMTFNQTSQLLYSADELAGSKVSIVSAQGSTDPEYALLETERIMLQSNKPTKLVFLLTDGQFYKNSDKIIKRLNDLGCTTNLVYLAGNEQALKWLESQQERREELTHGVHNFRAIVNPMDLVKVAKDIVRHHLTKGKR